MRRRGATGSSPPPHGFISERYDNGSGLQYVNARHYDPRLAMFIQPGRWEVTKEGDGTNRYCYSFNDPVNGRDPGGNVNSYLGGALDDTDPDDPMGQFKDDFEKNHPDEFDSKKWFGPIVRQLAKHNTWWCGVLRSRGIL